MADVVKFEGKSLKSAKELSAIFVGYEHQMAKLVTEMYKLTKEQKENTKKLRESPLAKRNAELRKQLAQSELQLQRQIGARDALGKILEKLKARPADTALTRILDDPEKAQIFEEANR